MEDAEYPDLLLFRPGQCVEQRDVFPRRASRKLRRCTPRQPETLLIPQHQTGFAAVLPRIDDVEFNSFKPPLPERKQPEVVLRPLIGPAADSVFRPLIPELPVECGTQVQRFTPVGDLRDRHRQFRLRHLAFGGGEQNAERVSGEFPFPVVLQIQGEFSPETQLALLQRDDQFGNLPPVEKRIAVFRKLCRQRHRLPVDPQTLPGEGGVGQRRLQHDSGSPDRTGKGQFRPQFPVVSGLTAERLAEAARHLSRQRESHFADIFRSGGIFRDLSGQSALHGIQFPAGHETGDGEAQNLRTDTAVGIHFQRLKAERPSRQKIHQQKNDVFHDFSSFLKES